MMTVIHCKSQASLKDFMAGYLLAAPAEPEKVTYGQDADSYWVLIEDSQDLDNNTYRLLAEGELMHEATGVEV